MFKFNRQKLISKMKIITRMVEDELYESSNPKGHLTTIDMRKSEIKKGHSPMEVLLSSLAACGAVDLVAMLRKRKKDIVALTVETDGTRREETPRAFTVIHCNYCLTSSDVTEDELHKFTKLSLEKYCSVAASLKSKITFSVQIIRPD